MRRDIEDASGANFVDTTTDAGNYVLNDLYSEYQAGVDYMLVAEKPGYERDFVDVTVTADGAFFEDGEDTNFNLEPREVDPDFTEHHEPRAPRGRRGHRIRESVRQLRTGRPARRLCRRAASKRASPAVTS
ncbi:MAG: hypothetical protein U5K28_12765 [Halobacteriales archaeon]|nr:hypothetical protein [Halobacteriales archaeon]